MKKILVIDGNSIIKRAYYGIRPLSTKDGRPTNAVYGMLNIVTHHLKTICPDYAAVAFDLKAPNFRKQRFSYYKEGRHETPPDLLAQFDDAKECLRYLGLHTLELEGYEADDILGTVASFAEAGEDIHAYVLSGDRDLLQLISPRVTVLLASTGETQVFDRDAFFAKYGIEPSEFVDLKALMGDSSDHIYGVPGVGEKTALKLISEFHSIDGVYENLDSPTVSKGVRAKLEAGKQSAYDSRWLAAICREVPLGISLDAISYSGIDNDRMYEKCVSLEFHQLIRKFGLNAPEVCSCGKSESDEKSIPSPIKEYKEATAEEILASISGEGFAIDVGECISLFDGERAFLFRGKIAELTPLFDGKRSVIAYDGKRLLHTLFAAGIDADIIPRDVMLYAYVLSGEGQNGLSSLSLRYLESECTEAEPAAAYIYYLEKLLLPEIEKIGARALLEKIELPLSPVLAKMEKAGFRLDTEALTVYGNELAEKMVVLAENITVLAGVEFNINSPKQLSEVLFEHLALPTKGLKKNKNGYSTDADTLASLRRYHPIIDEILAYRQISKLYSTYAVGLLKVADEKGDIHTDFKQALTATGRLSSAEPNLQNIPVRTALGRELRRVFIPKRSDCVLVDADYSQIELRLLAAISGDEKMCSAFQTGEDIHRKTASAVFGIPEGAVTDIQRSRAKAVNFGIVYGISAYSLSGDIGVSVAEAKIYMESYFGEYPGIKAYLDGVVANAEEKGYTETLFSRRRYIPELSSKVFAMRAFGKRVAMNSPIQGSAADIIKLAMVRVDDRLKREGLDAHLILQIHDELIVEAHASVAERVRDILCEEMEGAISLSVPLTVSTAIGKNWLDAEH